MNTIHHFLTLLKRAHHSSIEDPARDWLLLIAFATIALAGLTVWGAWTFDTVERGGTIGAAPKSTQPFFSSSALETIHSVFDSRAREEEKYASSTYHFIDPSQ